MHSQSEASSTSVDQLNFLSRSIPSRSRRDFWLEITKQETKANQNEALEEGVIP
jgi:hypothetical protein